MKNMKTLEKLSHEFKMEFKEKTSLEETANNFTTLIKKESLEQIAM